MVRRKITRVDSFLGDSMLIQGVLTLQPVPLLCVASEGQNWVGWAGGEGREKRTEQNRCVWRGIIEWECSKCSDNA